MECDTTFTNVGSGWNPSVFDQTLTPQSLLSDADSKNYGDTRFEDVHSIAGSKSHLSPVPTELDLNGNHSRTKFTPARVTGTLASLPDTNGLNRGVDAKASNVIETTDSSDHRRRSTPSMIKGQHSVYPQSTLTATSLASLRSTETISEASELYPNEKNLQSWQDNIGEAAAAKRLRLEGPASPVSAPRTPPDIARRRHLFIDSSPSSLLRSIGTGEAPPRAKSSIPSTIDPEQYASQCIHAAYSSRLNPFALHPDENGVLSSLTSDAQSPVYLAIRNGILRLWVRNPLIMITLEEALGCARDSRHFAMAAFAHEWLLRKGYINFGCVETYGLQPVKRGRGQLSKPITIVIVGAGVSGLSCARHLRALFTQYEYRLTAVQRASVPRIVILEGRRRIGGRVHSRALRYQRAGNLSSKLRNVAEMGAQIITGFEFGNPLDIVIRGQLALDYHPLKDNLVIYDYDGSMVDEAQDAKIQTFYNEMLEHISTYSWDAVRTTDTGMRKDYTTSSSNRNFPCLDSPALYHSDPRASSLTNASHSADFVRTTERQLPQPFSIFAERGSMLGKKSGSAYVASRASNQAVNYQMSLGAKMDETVQTYQETSKLSTKEMRLLNWHYANLEYSNAVNVDQLSLGGWDQDGGNEFDGFHAQVVGGYSQVVQGLSQYPTPLDVRLSKIVKHIHYSGQKQDRAKNSARVVTEDGEVFEADHVVATLPLGVLQSTMVTFHPPLPKSKTDAMSRLGFGLLNKVILVFETVFWEEDRDMFGMLNQSMVYDSFHQKDYEARRGKFYLFWNCVKTSGTPMLVALMAGDAAHETERTNDEILIRDVTVKLSKIFSLSEVPVPTEAIVTRWKKDPFARGTYSYLGPDAQPGDYDRMADPVGNLYFAGEATCGTHPATVHGALISGLRAAHEVCESVLGPIPLPESLSGEAKQTFPAGPSAPAS